MFFYQQRWREKVVAFSPEMLLLGLPSPSMAQFQKARPTPDVLPGELDVFVHCVDVFREGFYFQCFGLDSSVVHTS